MIISLIIAITLISCQSYTPPEKLQIANTKEFNKSYDEVWSGIVSWFGQKGTPIKNLDKNAGFISTEYDLKTNTYQYMDCGKGGVQTRALATINIVVTKKNDKVIVTVNAFFTCHLYYMGWDKGNDSRIDCVSKGILEKEVFDYIEKQ